MSRWQDVAGTLTKVYLLNNVKDVDGEDGDAGDAVTHRPVFFRVALLPSFPLYSLPGRAVMSASLSPCKRALVHLQMHGAK